ATVQATFDLTPAERIPRDLGTADVALRPAPPGKVIVQQDDRGNEATEPGTSPHGAAPRTAADVRRLLPPGSRVIQIRAPEQVHYSSRWLSPIRVTGVDLRDPLTQGMYRFEAGRPPAAPDEVAVSPWLVRHGAGIGSTLSLSGIPRPYRVVGVVAPPDNLNRPIAVTLPEGVRPGEREEWLADTPVPVTRSDIRRLNAEGLVVRSRVVLAGQGGYRDDRISIASIDVNPQRTADVAVLGLIVTMSLLEVALLAGPAFAVGVRRRQRELALLAAQGASGRQLGLVVLADGLLLGGLATVAGVAAGLAAAWAVIPVGEALGGGAAGPYDVPAGQVIVVAVLGLLSAVLAAAMPARRAARLDPVRALTGLRGEPRPRRGRPLLGLVLLVAGLAATFVSVHGVSSDLWLARVLRILQGPDNLRLAGGAFCAMVGFVLLTPLLVQAAAGRTARLPLALRFAGRDAARNRSRTAPAVAAVGAVTAAFVAALVGVSAMDRWEASRYQPTEVSGALTIRMLPADQKEIPRLRAAVQREFPGVPLIEAYRPTGRPAQVSSVVERCSTSPPGCPQGMWEPLIGGADLLGYLTGRKDPAAAAALASGKAVVFLPGLADGGSVELDIGGSPLPGTRVPAEQAVLRQPGVASVLLPVSMATDLGLKPALDRLVVDPDDHRVTPAEEERLATLLADGDLRLPVKVERGHQTPVTYTVLVLALGAGAALLALGGTLAATGLAAVDARPDVATMGAVGAPPRMRRLVTGAQAAFVAGTGVVPGALCGLVIGRALADQLVGASYFYLESGPWRAVTWPAVAGTAALVVLLPLVAGLVAAAFVRDRITLTRRMT
ncbi:FtsX-like permease family protein, partial [Sphaerisporangium rufum]|uniref:FtsX-like permease family protein n=1 Tax=Sphaerisporangium rufum TaxID=1381558 RepID=UPI001950BFD7